MNGNSAVEIRKLKRHEFYPAAQILTNAIFRDWGTGKRKPNMWRELDTSLRHYKDIHRTPRARVFGAFNGGRIVGTAAIVPLEFYKRPGLFLAGPIATLFRRNEGLAMKRIAFISDIGVDEEHLRRGISRELTAQRLRTAKRMGYSLVISATAKTAEGSKRYRQFLEEGWTRFSIPGRSCQSSGHRLTFFYKRI